MIITYLILGYLVRKALSQRGDGSPALPYWRAYQLGIEEERFTFKSGKWNLSGSRYYVKGNKPKALICFFHGLGAGRNSYIYNIAKFAKEGYLVYSFDYTGCMLSEGKHMYGFGHTSIDLKYFFRFLDKDEKAQGLPRYSVGHSWGGYTSLLSLKPEYKVEKCVDMSGFTRPSTVMNASLKKGNGFIRGLMHLYLSLHKNSTGGDEDGVKIIKKSSAKIMYVRGTKDNTVDGDINTNPLRKEFGGTGRIEFVDLEGWGHQPFLTKESEQYLNDCMDKGIITLSADKNLKMDLVKACLPNEDLYKTVFDFLAK
ncbi:MAG: lysophospholipase [Bacilli bacterium]|nr:lysophospholipase [Bacilli bacterium]